MSWQHISERVVKIRKVHLCHGCGRRYSPGQSMKYLVGANDGDFHASYWCPICDEYMKTDSFSWSNYDDGMGFGDLMEDDDYRVFRSKYKPMVIPRLGMENIQVYDSQSYTDEMFVSDLKTILHQQNDHYLNVVLPAMQKARQDFIFGIWML